MASLYDFSRGMPVTAEPPAVAAPELSPMAQLVAARASKDGGKGSLDRLTADLTRQQWADFEARYRPLEQRTLADIQTPFDPTPTREAVDAGMSRARGSYMRNLERLNVGLSAADNGIVQRRLALSSALSSAGATNAARRASVDDKTNAMADLIATGRGIQGSSLQALGSLAQMDAQRKYQNKVAAASSKQSLLSTGLGLAGMAISAFPLIP